MRYVALRYGFPLVVAGILLASILPTNLFAEAGLSHVRVVPLT